MIASGKRGGPSKNEVIGKLINDAIFLVSGDHGMEKFDNPYSRPRFCLFKLPASDGAR